MDPITLRLTRFQRRRHLLGVVIYAVVAALAGLGVSVAGPSAFGACYLLIFAGFGGLTVAAAGRLLGRATFDQQGITTVYLGRVRRVPWSAVGGVEAVMDSARRGPQFDERVRITLTSGKAFKLPAPFHSTLLGRDPKFDAKLEHIKSRWLSAVEAVGAERGQ